VAIAWALKESKIGDLLGNLIKTANNPEKLTQTFSVTKAKEKSATHQPTRRPERFTQPERPQSFNRPINKPTRPAFVPKPMSDMDESEEFVDIQAVG
jgi:hypothetical protein